MGSLHGMRMTGTRRRFDPTRERCSMGKRGKYGFDKRLKELKKKKKREEKLERKRLKRQNAQDVSDDPRDTPTEEIKEGLEPDGVSEDDATTEGKSKEHEAS